MSVTIGHASIDERGKASGGRAGDQTGREVCTRSWYSKGWKYCLRPKSATVAERMAKACEQGCANNKIGYDQSQRNSLHYYAKRCGYNLAIINTKCETDCSAFMTVCALAGGVSALEYSGNAPTTSTMVDKFRVTGAFTVLTDSKYLTGDAYLKRGDILVKPGSHTVMVLSNGSKAGATTTPSAAPAQPGKLTVDGQIGKGTIKAFQQLLGTAADGYISGQSASCKKYWPAICNSACGWTGGKSQFVAAMQSAVGTSADGLLGKGTAAALQSFLCREGFPCSVDGVFGTESAKALQRWLNS